MSRAPYNSGIAQDLLNTLHYKEHPQFDKFIFDAAYELESLMELSSNPREDYEAVLDGMEALIALLEDLTPEVTPEKYFDMMGFGHFKECYAFSPHIVLKFCAERNPTKEEEQIPLDAFNNDMDEMFVPTRYLELPRYIESATLEKDDDDAEVYDEDNGGWCENPEWHDNTILTHICFQLITDIVPEDDGERDAEFLTNPKYWAETCADCGIPPEETPDAWQGLAGACRIWVTALIERRGLDYVRKFAEFCFEYHVWDLHADNVGFIRSYNPQLPLAMPVVLDWMSK